MVGKTTLTEAMKRERVNTGCSESVNGAAGLELTVSSPHGSTKTLKLRTCST